MVQSVAFEVNDFHASWGHILPTKTDTSPEKTTKEKKKICEKESKQWWFQQSWKVSTWVADAQWQEQYDAKRLPSGVTLLVLTTSQLSWSVPAT